jgi:uncharacterized protein YbjQ (UPF0145 family)
MKRIKIFTMLLVLVGICGCSAIKYPYIQDAGMIDYSKYAEKGFFITESNSVSFEYIPIGSVSARSVSGYEAVGIKIGKELLGDDVYPVNRNDKAKIKYGKFIEGTPERAIEELYKKAVKWKANGIIGLTITPITTTNPVSEGFFVTGMAIRK